MIYIKDNFLDQELFDLVKKDITKFDKIDFPGKSFWVHPASDELIKYITIKLSIIENCKVENILAFFREAKKNQDDDWRIHNDSIIENQLPDRAAVLYISPNTLSHLNGTAFWEHEKHGDTFPMTGTVEKFNDMLANDANDQSKWTLKSVIGHKENRLVSYPCNYFHSKYPNEFEESRIIFVIFYKIK
jgi:hypothetical protein|tara:strand:- start:230 stop:793 length:564 start_codon:yes stop_codon:yes gene_type:complete